MSNMKNSSATRFESCLFLFLLCWWDDLAAAAAANLPAGLTMEMCRNFLVAADTPPVGDNSGGISVNNGEYREFIRLLGERKCYKPVSPPPNGPQYIVFLNLFCGDDPVIPGMPCLASSQIPLTINDTIAATVCTKVDALIFEGTCPDTQNPTTRPPSISPSQSPVTESPTTILRGAPILPAIPIVPGLTLQDCQRALALSANEPPLDEATFDEYKAFLTMIGQMTCFSSSSSLLESAQQSVFAQLRCETNSVCQGAVTIDLQDIWLDQDRLRDFCLRSYTFALGAPLCPTPAPSPSGATTPTPQLSTPSNSANNSPRPTRADGNQGEVLGASSFSATKAALSLGISAIVLPGTLLFVADWISFI